MACFSLAALPAFSRPHEAGIAYGADCASAVHRHCLPFFVTHPPVPAETPIRTIAARPRGLIASMGKGLSSSRLPDERRRFPVLGLS